MKFTIDVDCTPEEARRFLGLPDVTPMQDRMLEEMEKRMMESMKGFDMESLMKQWMTPGLEGAGLEGFNKMAQAFWQNMGGFTKGGSTEKK